MIDERSIRLWLQLHQDGATDCPASRSLVIEDRLKNTGKKPIDTTVYNHHFMTLSPGEDGVELQAPFTLAQTRPMPADVVKFDGDRMTYLRGLTGQEQVAGDLTGFTNAVSDNDFRITDYQDRLWRAAARQHAGDAAALVVGALHHGDRALYGREAEARRGKALDPHTGLLRSR